MTIKKGLLSALLFLLFTLPAIASEKCYLFVEKSGFQNSDILLSMAVTLVTKYVTPVEPIPDEGIGSDQCALAVSVVESDNELFLSVKGKKYNFFGKSTQRNTDGITEALVKGIYQISNDKSKKKSLCADYEEILRSKCLGYQPSPPDLPEVTRQRSPKVLREKQRFPPQFYIANDTKKQRESLKKGWRNLQLGKFGKARKWFRKAIDNNPGDGRAYFGLGKVFQRQGNLERAQQSFRKACEKNFKQACRL